MILDTLAQKKLIIPPSWLCRNVHFLAIMGSRAHGTNYEDADYDLWGWVIPPKISVLPHTEGYIDGFGEQPQKFEKFEASKVFDKETGKEYDVNVWGIVQYFEKARVGNPNYIEGLFAPQTSIVVQTPLAAMVRDHRHLFLSKLCWKTFKSYAFGQMKNIRNKKPVGKRTAIVNEHGWDTKYGMHLVRLLNEIEDIMSTGDLDIQRNREQNKEIRRGEWSIERLEEYFATKERELESLYTRCDLPEKPDEAKLKTLLINCLEAHYGNLGNAIVQPDQTISALRKIDEILDGLKAQKVM